MAVAAPLVGALFEESALGMGSDYEAGPATSSGVIEATPLAQTERLRRVLSHLRDRISESLVELRDLVDHGFKGTPAPHGGDYVRRP